MDGHWYTAEYSTFYLDPPYEGFRLTVGGYSGDAGDAFNKPVEYWGIANGMKFSTQDSDNDLKGNSNCASNHGAWWHNRCSFSNLNHFPTNHGYWKTDDVNGDVQASRMWISIGKSESPYNSSLFLCSFVCSYAYMCVQDNS